MTYYDILLDYTSKLVQLKKSLLSPDEILQYIQTSIRLSNGKVNINTKEVDD